MYYKTISLLFLMGCLVLGLRTNAQAGEGYVIYDAPNVSGYHVTTLAQPNPVSVGKIHLLIRLARATEANQELPVRNAQVLVEFRHLSGPGADEVASYVQRNNLVASESEPGTYEISDSLQNEGVYQINFTIEDGSQKTQTSFEIKALPEPDDRFFSVMLLSLAPIFLAWLVWMYLKRPAPVVSKEVQS